MGDGLVGLPEDARSEELLEWVADDVVAAGGDALLWRAQALAGSDERLVAQAMADARGKEYRTIISAAEAGLGLAAPEARRLLRKLRRELQAVRRRDYFPPPEREAATRALGKLAAAAGTIAAESIAAVETQP